MLIICNKNHIPLLTSNRYVMYYSDDVDEQLMLIAKLDTCPEERNALAYSWMKCISRLFSSMISTMVCIDRHLMHQFTLLFTIGALIGFTNIGDIIAQFESFEKNLEGEKIQSIHADHMLVIMFF